MLVYAALGYLMLACMRWCRVHGALAVFCAGAAAGWLCEGVYGMTLLGAGGIPFPFTIVWTGLAWHALLSVLLGWWTLGIALRERGPLAVLAWSAAIGAFWGVWALGWAEETPPVVVETGAFLANVGISTAALAVAQRQSGGASRRSAPPGSASASSPQ